MQAGREVKYQAWIHEIKAMVNVIEINFQEKHVSFYDCTGLDDAEAFELIRNGMPNADCPFEECELRQFTGLHDKNGKEIYEGDILQVPDWYELPENTSMTYNHQVVTFENCSFCLGGESMSHDHDYISEECEVIGNIYEKPELLPSA